jgi:gluconate 2-dehydrogenase gamma chain
VTAGRDDVDRLFFDEHQWETIEAAMARIIPTDGDPGAREAHTVVFVDRYLSGIDYIYAKPDGSGFRTLSGKVADVWQKRIDRLRGIYLEGIATLDRISQERFNHPFVWLSEDQQDQVLQTMARLSGGQEELLEEEGTLAAFEMPEASMQQAIAEHQLDFFPLLALHARQGYYADPVYGGNRDHLGWKTIGFPGPSSMAEVHQGRFSTLPYFAEQPAATRTGGTE